MHKSIRAWKCVEHSWTRAYIKSNDCIKIAVLWSCEGERCSQFAYPFLLSLCNFSHRIHKTYNPKHMHIHARVRIVSYFYGSRGKQKKNGDDDDSDRDEFFRKSFTRGDIAYAVRHAHRAKREKEISMIWMEQIHLCTHYGCLCLLYHMWLWFNVLDMNNSFLFNIFELFVLSTHSYPFATAHRFKAHKRSRPVPNADKTRAKEKKTFKSIATRISNTSCRILRHYFVCFTFRVNDCQKKIYIYE